MLMLAVLVDWLSLVIAIVAPIVLIWRLKAFGVVLGTLVPWGSLFLAGILISRLDPEREAGMLDAVWILFGWIPGLIYSSILYVLICSRRRQASQIS